MPFSELPSPKNRRPTVSLHNHSTNQGQRKRNEREMANLPNETRLKIKIFYLQKKSSDFVF
jgi:hypothetical protein